MKTLYRVSLLPNSNSLCDTIAVLACKFNGGQNKYTLENFKTICEAEKMLYPTLSGECTIELLDENTFHIDKKIGEEYQTVLIIERVEIMELEKPQILAPTDAIADTSSKISSEINFSFWRHLSEEEQIQAQAFDKRKSELTEAFNKLLQDFKITNPRRLISVDIWEDGRFKTVVDYQSWLDSRK